MKHTRLLALLLAIFMLASTACGKTPADDKPGNDTAAPGGDTTETTADPNLDEAGIPKDLVFGTADDPKLFRVIESGALSPVEELTEESNVLIKAQYEQARMAEERFGIDFVWTTPSGYADVQPAARLSINSGSDDYEWVGTVAKHQVTLINEGLYVPVEDLTYVDLDQPWWDKAYIESVSTVPEQPYFLFGDLTYNSVERTTCVFINFNILDKYLKMTPDDIYSLVRNGEWTIDKFTELAHSVYDDANGNSINDKDDIHGAALYNTTVIDWLAYSSGIKFSTRNEDGYPVLNLNTEEAFNLAEKLQYLYFGNQGAFYGSDNAGTLGKFTKSHALFYVNRFYFATSMSKMEDDYGILPMPKYDATIDGYHSTVETLVNWTAVPITCSDLNLASAVAEEYGYLGKKLTTPAYFENTLKAKLTRDDASMEMIDIVLNGRETDYLYINRLGKLGNVFQNVYSTGQNNFASYYASYEAAGIETLNGLIATAEAMKNN